MPEAQPLRLHIELNPAGVVGPVQLATRRVAQALRLALPAIDAHDFTSTIEIGPPISIMGFQPWGDAQADKGQLETWLVAAMLQELSRGIRASLEEALVFSRLVAIPPDAPQPMDILDRLKLEAARANLPDLLRLVNEALQTQLGFAAEMEALNRARNCLEHGRGVVRPRDCDPDAQVMTLQMPYFGLFRRGRAGEEIELVAGVPLPDDGPHDIYLRRLSHAFAFDLGAPLALSREQVEAAVIGCTLFGIDLQGRLPRLPAPETA